MCALDTNAKRHLEQVRFDNHLVLVLDSSADARLIFAQRKYGNLKRASSLSWEELKRGGVALRAFTLFFLKAALIYGDKKASDNWGGSIVEVKNMQCLLVEETASPNSW